VSFKLFELFGTVDANTKPFDNALAGSQRSLTGFASFAQRVSAGVSRSFERMARSISASRAFDQLGRSVGAVANGLRASVGGGTALFGALSLAAGTAGVFLTLRKAVMGASDLNETLQKTGVVFGGATGIVTKGADEMARRFGVVKNEYLDAASSLGLIGKSAGLSEAKSAKLADQLARLAIDASSFYNVPLEEALISMRAGLVGESEPLRRFGVLLNEAAVQNEALRLGLATTKKEISEGAKVQARSSLIIKGLADATGDLERTEGSFANRLRKISGQITNMLTAVGQNILPIFQSLADVAQRALTDINSFLEDNSAAVRAWSERVAAGIAFAGRIWKNFAEFKELGFLLVHQKILQGIEAIKGAFWTLAEIARPIWDNLVATAKDGLTIIMNAFKGLQRYLETLFESIGQALTAALVNAVADSVNNPMIAALGDTTMFRAMFAPLQAVAQTAKIQAPPVRGDTSGFSPDAIMKGTVKTPALIETMADAMNSVFSVILKDLPQINREIDGVVKRIEKAWAVDLLAEMFGDTPKRFREGFQNLIKRTMTPVERLNADNLRRGLKRANFTDTSKEGQARAEGILKRRAAEEAEARKKGRLGGPTFDGTKLGLKLNTPVARDLADRRADANALAVERGKQERAQLAGLSGKSLRDAIESQRLKRQAQGTRPEEIKGTNTGSGRGIVGAIGKGVGNLAGAITGAIGDKFGLGEAAGAAVTGVTAGIVGGLSGIAAAVQGKGDKAGKGTPAGAQGRGRGGPGGNPLAGAEFKSEFMGLAEFSKKFSADVLSRDKKDPQLNALEGISKAIGGGQGEGDSVVGLLKGIKQAGMGPGFAV
jgi:hypothetical protein